MKTSWTDQPPTFLVNMSFSPEGGITSITTVNEVVEDPIVRFTVWVKDGNKPANTVYNISSKLCEFQNAVTKIPIFKTVSQTLKPGNYSFDCPMKVGVYIMDNVRLKNRNPFLSFIYRPNTIFGFNGGMFRKLDNGTTISLTTYNIVCKVIKLPCKTSG